MNMAAEEAYCIKNVKADSLLGSICLQGKKEPF